jgi:hypothetical protein
VVKFFFFFSFFFCLVNLVVLMALKTGELLTELSRSTTYSRHGFVSQHGQQVCCLFCFASFCFVTISPQDMVSLA